jgi:hypothetical protein
MDAPVVEAHKLLGISLESWLTILAIIVGPMLALFAQRALDWLRERRNRKVRLFRELMVTRYMRLSLRHVEALNMVPLEFKDEGDEKKVLDAWKEYLDHLGTDATIDGNAWGKAGFGLLVDLLFEMSKALNYDFEKLRIRKEAYSPKLFADVEAEWHTLRKQLVELTDGTGRRKLPVASFEQPFPDLKPPAER